MLTFNTNTGKVTFTHFYTVPITGTGALLFILFMPIICCFCGAFSFLLALLDLLDPDPSGHRLRIQCESLDAGTCRILMPH
jgi:hypothetical protein